MINESLKTWIKILSPALGFLVIGGIWIGKIGSDVKVLKEKSKITISSIDKEDIESELAVPLYKIEQNFQAIRKLQESQIEIQKQNVKLTVILDTLEKRVTRGGN